MQATWISSRDLNGRITAGQFLSSSLRSLEKIKNGKYQPSSISKIGKVRGGKRLPPNSRYVTDGIPYVRSTDIRDLRVDFSQVVKISIEHQKTIANYPLEYQDVVVGIAGTIGTIGLVDENVGPCHFNENLARITDIQINPAYLAVYLDSKLGQAFIDYLKGGAVQPKLSLININRIQVPLPPREVQDRIAGKMQAAYAARREKLAEAEKLLKNVEAFMFGKLAIDVVALHRPRAAIKRISEIAGGRLDFAAVVADTSLNLNGTVATRLGEVVAQVTDRILTPEECPDEAVNYISLAHIGSNTGELVDFAPVRGSEVLSSSVKFRQGDILFGRMRPYLNKVWIAEFDGICTGEAVVLRPNTEIVDRAFLHALLLSQITLMQVVPFQSGTSLPRVSASHILGIKLPIPKSMERQNEISAEIIRRRTEAKRLRAEAEQVVAQAKARVERMILGEEGA